MSGFEFEGQFENAKEPRGTGEGPRGSSVAPATDVAAGPVRLFSQIKQALSEFDVNDGAESGDGDQSGDQPDAAAVQLLMKNAVVLMDAKEHRLAVNILRNVLMRAPENPEALKQMGQCHRENGHYEQALKCFKAWQRAGGGVEAQIQIADTLYLGERDEMALGAYREVMKSVIVDASQLFEIYKNVGNIHVRAGDFEAAEEYYDKAYTLCPDSDVLLVNYGTLEIQRENMGHAVERFRKAVEINPSNDKAWVGLAMVHRHMGDLDLAWANIQRALDLNMANRTAIRLVVDWGVQDHRLSTAIDRLQDYLTREGEDAEMSFTLAKLFTYVGRVIEARLEMERVMALDPAIEGADALVRALDQELRRTEKF